ncbi:MAG: hypothetical protein OEX01_07730 [Candidatus Bathyarchaeota archaeon]|nr:hypothetical protein [Candidatus Bathyarchaeota archaeon]
MVFQKILKLWVAWLLGLAVLIGGVALVAYHVKDIPYAWNFVGLGTILGLIGFVTLMGTTAWMMESTTKKIDS